MAAPALAAMASHATPAVDRSEIGLYRYMQECDNPRMSMTFSHTKGLLNAPGQNNCFLNSAVQVFWHLDVFRRNFRRLSGHMCMGRSCIFCALKVIFTQFQHSDKEAQPPDPLRRALAHTFADQQRFQLGFMDDAAECFENILLRIHTHIAPNEQEDQCRAKHCIPHRKFSLAITEQVACDCGGVTEPFSYNEMVFYVSTSALVTEGMAAYQANPSDWGNFAHLLKETVAKGDTRSCPRNCGKRCDKKRILTNHPDVVSIGLVWDSAKSGAEHIQDVVGCVGTTLKLQELFHNSTTPDAIKHNTTLNLVGVVCYYGKHYSTFFFHSKVEEWIYFDDASVKQVSPNWEDVVDRIVRGRHQPLLLLYMNPHTQLLSVDTAPQCTEMVRGYEWQNDAASVSAGLNGQEEIMKSSGSLSSLPPPPPGFDGASSDSSSTTSSVTPVFSSSSMSKQPQQWPSVQHKSTTHDGANSANFLATYACKNAPVTAAIPRQLEDRDSGADEGSYTDLDRQSSHVSTDDTASSYSSRASGSSSSCTGDRELYAHRSYVRAVSGPAYSRQSSEVGSCNASGSNGDRLPKDGTDKCQERQRMRKKKSRGSQGNGHAPAAIGGMTSSSRCLSAVSLASAGSEPAASSSGSRGDSSNRQSGHGSSLNSGGSDPPGYATLPRKKKVKPSTDSSTAAVAAADELSRHVEWIKEVAKKSEQLQPSVGVIASFSNAPLSRSAPTPKADECADVRNRIRQFNGLGSATAVTASAAAAVGSWGKPVPAAAANATASPASTSACPASQRCSSSSTVLKPMPLYGGAADAWQHERAATSTVADNGGYINRHSVERFIKQQRSSTITASPTKEQRPSAAHAGSTLASEFAGLRLTVAATGSVDTASVGSLKDSGYRSGGAGGCGGSSGGDRTSLSSVGSSSLFSESPSHRTGGNGNVFDFGPSTLGPSKQTPMPAPAAVAGSSAAHWAPAAAVAAAAAVPDEHRRSTVAASRSCMPPSAARGSVGVVAVGESSGGGTELEEDDFPPPPSEQELQQCISLMGSSSSAAAAGWHVKQGSQGSLSSETSTLRNSCGGGGSKTDCTDEDDDDDYRSRNVAAPSAPSNIRQLSSGHAAAVEQQHQQLASVDVCDAPCRQVPWSSATVSRPESSSSLGSGSGSIAPAPHPQLSRVHSSSGPAVAPVAAAWPGADGVKSTATALCTARPVTQASLPYGHKASVGCTMATGGSVQPLSNGHGRPQQNLPHRFSASAHDSEGKVPSQAAAAAAVALPSPAASTRKADEPKSDAARRLSSSSSTSSAATASSSSPAAPADGRPIATPPSLPPWQQQPAAASLQRCSAGSTETRELVRASIQPAVPSSSSGGRCGAIDGHLVGPVTSSSSVHGSLERSFSTPVAGTTQSTADASAMSSSLYASRTAAAAQQQQQQQQQQQRSASTESDKTTEATVQCSVPTGPSARTPVAASAAAAFVPGAAKSVNGGNQPGEVTARGQVPRLYGEVQPPNALAAASARQRDSYAQSLGNAAADLFSRGMMLPPKVRRDTAASTAMAPATAAGGVLLPRTQYELGFSHYDKLPRSQQPTAVPPWPPGASAGSSGGSGAAGVPGGAPTRPVDQRDAAVPSQSQSLGALPDRGNGSAAPWSDQLLQQQQQRRDAGYESFQLSRSAVPPHAQGAIEQRLLADSRNYSPQQPMHAAQQHYAARQPAAPLTPGSHAQPSLGSLAPRQSACSSSVAVPGSCYGQGLASACGGSSTQPPSTEQQTSSQLPPWHRSQQPPVPTQPLGRADHRLQQPMRFAPGGAVCGKVAQAPAVQWDGL